MKKKILAFGLFVLCTTSATAQQRHEVMLEKDWLFSRDKTTWQTVRVPHDWAISGPFDKRWDLQTVAIEQNGEKQATEKSGRSGALPWIGEGHYRRWLTIPAGVGHAELLFEGAMAEPTVCINGQRAGYWAYGYNAFRVDITPFVKPGENLLEVDLHNVEESSRWYPGAGIYRPVKLILTDNIRLDPWALYVRTTEADSTRAQVAVDARVAEYVDEQGLRIQMQLTDRAGNVVASYQQAIDGSGCVKTALHVEHPRLWSPETPYLYSLTTRLYQNDALKDELTTRVGIRTACFSAEGGFQLNGVTRKIQGVCMHHDLGPLGAALNRTALVRQLKLMKEMGADAIRTAHNMPPSMQMDLCDSLGLMVMAESFDMWQYPKCKNGYARFFSEWAERDITNLVLHHRNHPSIILWSIGNEIPEQGQRGGTETARRLQDLCHRLDPSRQVTQGMNKPDDALRTGFAQVMDVPGFNYRVFKYDSNIRQLPQGFLLGAETASTVSSRGVYKFPVEPLKEKAWGDGQSSSYDVECCSWSNLPDDDWPWQDDKPWVVGEFVWTGFDYLGEPTPYDTYWPSRSSYFGLCDLAGIPKDRYWLYRSRWRKDDHTTHLLPHWTWPERKGEVTPVYCYTDGVEGELFVNGKSQGRIRKDPSSRLDRYRLRWSDVRYEPGIIEVVTYDNMGREIGRDSHRTAGKAAHINYSVWTQHGESSHLKADADDLAFITLWLEDEAGTRLPTADYQMDFAVSGAGSFQAACNGDATSLEPFTLPRMRLFSGQLVIVIRASERVGDIILDVTIPELQLLKSIRLAVNN